MTSTQDRAIRHLLAQLELISHGTITAYNSAGGGHSERDPRPTGESRPPHDVFRARYETAKDDHERDKIISAARAELRDLRKSNGQHVRPETEQEFDARARAKLAEGWTVAEVAHSMRCTPTRIRRVQATTKHPDVRSLAEQGMTIRGIAMRTGLSKSEVHRLLKRAA